MTKQELRHHIRKLKAERSATELNALSHAICQRMETHPIYQAAGTILLYHPLPDEVDVRPLLRAYWNKRLLLPVVVGQELELRMYAGENTLAAGAFGILEPTGEAFTELDAIELAVVPGIAFTEDGHRLGRGGGYYDRLLPQLTHAFRLGVCWPFQMVESLPSESYDIRMDEVIR